VSLCLRVCRWAGRALRLSEDHKPQRRDEQQARAVASFLVAVWTEICLRNVCSCHEILRRNGGRQRVERAGGFVLNCGGVWRVTNNQGVLGSADESRDGEGRLYLAVSCYSCPPHASRWLRSEPAQQRALAPVL
jgi:hypothetical protein